MTSLCDLPDDLSVIYRFVLPHLPPDLQALILNPPSLSSPQSFIPLIKTILPYTKYLIVLTAFYIVWATLTSLFGYFSRFLRFSLRVGPIIALLGWLMANSGQGSLEEVFQAVKEYVGLADYGGGARSPGIANLFGTGDAGGAGRRKKTTSRKSDPISSRTRGRRQQGTTDGTDTAAEFLSSMLNSATGQGVGDGQGDWQGVVGDYVKKAMAKASGLDWLFGRDEDQDGRRGTR